MAAAFAATAVLGSALHTKDKPATVLGRPSVALVARAFPYTAPIAKSAVPVIELVQDFECSRQTRH